MHSSNPSHCAQPLQPTSTVHPPWSCAGDIMPRHSPIPLLATSNFASFSIFSRHFHCRRSSHGALLTVLSTLLHPSQACGVCPSPSPSACDTSPSSCGASPSSGAANGFGISSLPSTGEILVNMVPRATRRPRSRVVSLPESSVCVLASGYSAFALAHRRSSAPPTPPFPLPGDGYVTRTERTTNVPENFSLTSSNTRFMR